MPFQLDLRFAGAMGVAPRTCVVIGDSPLGLTAAGGRPAWPSRALRPGADGADLAARAARAELKRRPAWLCGPADPNKYIPALEN